MLKQMWPYVGDYVKNLLKTQFEASLAATMSGYKLYNFKFEKIYLGDIVSRSCDTLLQTILLHLG